METFKSATLKGKSYDTFESTYTNQIMTAPFAKFQVAAVTDIDIQSYLSELGKRGYSISTILMKCGGWRIVNMRCWMTTRL